MAKQLTQPTSPFLFVNQHCMIRVGPHFNFRSIRKRALVDSLTKGAWVVDVNCRYFDVIGIEDRGISICLASILKREQFRKVKLIYSDSKLINLDHFIDMATSIVIERRWNRQTRETEAKFLERIHTRQNAREVMEALNFYGKWCF